MLSVPVTHIDPPESGARLRRVPPAAPGTPALTYEQAIQRCGRLAHTVARRFAPRRTADYDDVVQEAGLAILSASETWRDDGGAAFSTYAYFRMVSHLSVFTKRARRRGLSAGNGGRMGTIRDAVIISTDDNDDEADELGESARQEIELGDAEELAILRYAVEQLDPRDRDVLSMLDDDMTQEQIAARLDVTQTRVSQLVIDIHSRVRRCALEGRAPAARRRRSASVAHNGRSLTMVEWSRESGIGIATIRQRLGNGWTMSEALETPARVMTKGARDRASHV